MLAKKFRLAVNRFPQKARILYRGRHLTVKFAPSNLPYNRVGVIVTRKTAPKAVERNKLRRRIFDSFRATPNFLKEATLGSDFLVVVKPVRLNDLVEDDLLGELNVAITKVKK